MLQLKPHPSWVLGTLCVLTLFALWLALQGNRQLQNASAEWRALRQDTSQKQIAIARANSALGQADLTLPGAEPAPQAAAALDRVGPALDSLQRTYRAGGLPSLQEERHLAELRDASVAYQAAMMHGALSASRPLSAVLAALEQSTTEVQQQADGALADSSQAAHRLVYRALAAVLAINVLGCGIAWRGGVRSADHG